MEDETKQLPILERILTELQNLNARVERLEARAYDTKPIWERALKEIIDLGRKVDDLAEQVHTTNRQMNVLSRDMVNLRADQSRLEDRFERLKEDRLSPEA